MPRKRKVSAQKAPAGKRRFNRGLLVLGFSIVVIMGIVLVSVLASSALTKKSSETTSAAQPAPDLTLATATGELSLS